SDPCSLVRYGIPGRRTPPQFCYPFTKSTRPSHINLFRDGKFIINLDAEVSDGTFDLGMAEQQLNRSQMPGAPVDQGGLGSSQRVGAEEIRIEPDAGNPFGDKPRVLSC